MRPECRKLLKNMELLGRPALISELREGFRVNDRTLRRWLLALCGEGRVEATGSNKGRRYRLAAQPEAAPNPRDLKLDAFQEELMREAIGDAATGGTLPILLRERARAQLPAAAREGFAKNTLRRLRAMTDADAEALGIPPKVFKYWQNLHAMPGNRDDEAPDRS